MLSYLLLILLASLIFFYYYIIIKIQSSARRSLEDIYTKPERCETYNIFDKKNPSDYGLNYENISFVNKDNMTLKGWYIKGGKGVIILCHGRSGNRLATMQYLDILKDKSILDKYSILLFDMRNGGYSPRAKTGIGEFFSKDISSAIDFMNVRGHKNFYLWGFSMGSMAVIKAIKEKQNNISIDGIIMDSPLVNGEKTITYTFIKEGQNQFIANLASFFYNINLKNKLREYSFGYLLKDINYKILIFQSKTDLITPYNIFSQEMEQIKNKELIEIVTFEEGEHLSLRNIQQDIYDSKVKEFLI